MRDYEHGCLLESVLLPVSPLPAHPPQVYQSEYLKQKLSSEFPVQIFNDHLPPPPPLQLSPNTSPVSRSFPCLPTPNQTIRWSLQMGFIVQGPHALTVLPSPWDITSVLCRAKPHSPFKTLFCVTAVCVCLGTHDRLWVPEAGSIAILTSLVPSPLLGTEQAGMDCLQGLHYYFNVSPCLFLN